MPEKARVLADTFWARLMTFFMLNDVLISNQTLCNHD